VLASSHPYDLYGCTDYARQGRKTICNEQGNMKGDIKINLQKWHKNLHQGQGPAVVSGNCGNEHPGTKKT